MDSDTSEKIRDVISFVHSRTLSIGVYSPGDISVANMYEEAASELAEIIQQEIAKAQLSELKSLQACKNVAGEPLVNMGTDVWIDDRIAELSQTLKEGESS